MGPLSPEGKQSVTADGHEMLPMTAVSTDDVVNCRVPVGDHKRFGSSHKLPPQPAHHWPAALAPALSLGALPLRPLCDVGQRDPQVVLRAGVRVEDVQRGVLGDVPSSRCALPGKVELAPQRCRGRHEVLD